MKTLPRIWFDLIEPLEARIAPATFIVNSLLDGASAKDGKLTLREAIIAATTNAAFEDAPAGSALADTITFAPALAGQTIQLSNTLLITGGGQLSITGPGTTMGSIALSAAANTRVFDIENGSGAVSLSHLTIENGHATSSAGGGIFTSSDLDLDDVLVANNTSLNGGGIRITGAAKVSIVHSRFEQNTVASFGSGGGISNGSTEPLTIRDTTIESNSAFEGAGVSNSGTATISTSRITGNHGGSNGDGAGIVNAGTLTLEKTTVSGNVGLGSGFDGGGIRNDGDLTIRDSTISHNVSPGAGGGIFSAVSNNTLTIINSTIADNTALGGSGGGGINTTSLTQLTNSTIVGNLDTTANGAGGIIAVNSGNTTLTNTVVAGNFVTSGNGGHSADVKGTFTAASKNNFIGVGDGGNFANGTNGNLMGTSTTPLDPKLGPLQDNGGLTFTMAPLTGSPLIDAGDNASALSASGAALLSDQRGPGYSRFLSATSSINNGNQELTTVDIGAVEAGFIGGNSVFGATSFTFLDSSSSKMVSVSLTGGGTFDLLADLYNFTIGEIEIHGATAKSVLAVKALTTGATVNIDAIHADGPMKGITLGKGMVFTGSIGVEGALGALTLDTMTGTPFIQTGGTAKQVLSIKTNGDFTAAVDTTSAVGAISMPKFSFFGAIRAASIGAITAREINGETHDDTFGFGDNGRQDLIATSGPIGRLTTTDGSVGTLDIVAGPGALGTFGGIGVTSKEDNRVGIIEVNATAATIGSIAATMTGSGILQGINVSDFTATNGGITSVAVSLNFTLPANPGSFGMSGSAFVAAAGIGAITVTSKVPTLATISSSTFTAGTATLPTWTALTTAKLQAAALAASSIGAIKVSGSIDSSTLLAAGNIGAVTAPLGLTHSKLLAGTSQLGGVNFYVRPVSIGALTIGTPFGSIIEAGVDPKSGGYGDGDDDVGIAGLLTTSSKIGAIKITGATLKTVPFNVGNHTSSIQAGAIGKITLNGTVVPPFSVIDTVGSPTDNSTDTVIRLLPLV